MTLASTPATAGTSVAGLAAANAHRNPDQARDGRNADEGH